MKLSEIKEGEVYLCRNGEYRGVVLFWNDESGDLAYVKLVRVGKTSRFMRATWISGFCSIKYFAKIAVSQLPRTQKKKPLKKKRR
jgi:hypothetical protein